MKTTRYYITVRDVTGSESIHWSSSEPTFNDGIMTIQLESKDYISYNYDNVISHSVEEVGEMDDVIDVSDEEKINDLLKFVEESVQARKDDKR